jgi:hypothetical protein
MRRFIPLATGLILVFASLGYAQGSEAPQDRVIPQFKVQIWGETFVDFNSRMLAYEELRRRSEEGLSPLTTSDNPAEIRKAIRARAKKIRAARADAREGDIFTPAISDSFKRALADEVDPGTCDAIGDDNPGRFKHRINGSYPEGLPLSTVPPNVLAALPKLPDDLQYRFVGRHLVLLDGRSGLILDRIRFSISCGASGSRTTQER